MDEADNFWASGPTGPCGPCSEIYYDFHPERGTTTSTWRTTALHRVLQPGVHAVQPGCRGHLTPLQNRNIDTGMGLERMAQILQGAEQLRNRPDLPMIETAAKIAGQTTPKRTPKPKSP
jgi:alanyl-tRNA synthetase